MVLACLFGPLGAPDPLLLNPNHVYQGPSGAHWLGTDELGRDVLARLLVGGRVSLLVAFLGSSLAIVVGGFLGLWAGYRAGWADRFLVRATELLLALPQLPLLLLLAAVDLDRLGWPMAWRHGATESVFKLVVVLAFFGAAGPLRLARATARQLRQSPQILSIRGLGASEFWIVRHHLIGAATTPLLAVWPLRFAELLLLESVISFLGLGVAPPAPSWGGLLARGLSHAAGNPVLLLAPGLVTVALVASLYRLADDLRARLDPRALASESAAG